jgi:hypothetical protein
MATTEQKLKGISSKESGNNPTNQQPTTNNQHVKHTIHPIHTRSQQILSGLLEGNVSGPSHRNAATGRNLY